MIVVSQGELAGIVIGSFVVGMGCVAWAAVMLRSRPAPAALVDNEALRWLRFKAFARAAEYIEKSPTLFAGHYAGAKRLADQVRELWREDPKP